MSKSDDKQWKKLESKEIFGSKYFHIRIDKCEDFKGKIVPKYFVVDFPEWVQAVALTPENEIILVKQYRYPGQGWFLEFPGGTTAGSRDEDPLTACKRELKEETGFESEEWEFIGAHYANPALLNNRCHVYLAKNCKKTSELNLDPFEDLEPLTMPLEAFEKEFLSAPKHHSLMLATWVLVKTCHSLF